VFQPIGSSVNQGTNSTRKQSRVLLTLRPWEVGYNSHFRISAISVVPSICFASVEPCDGRALTGDILGTLRDTNGAVIGWCKRHTDVGSGEAYTRGPTPPAAGIFAQLRGVPGVGSSVSSTRVICSAEVGEKVNISVQFRRSSQTNPPAHGSSPVGKDASATAANCLLRLRTIGVTFGSTSPDPSTV
jgi:hypothetical protein